MKSIQVRYEIFIFDLSKMFKTMNIHFKCLKMASLSEKFILVIPYFLT